MAKPLRIFLFATACFITGKSFAQIVNMESQRYHTDTTGWRGSIAGNISITSNGQKIFTANADAHVQYQSKKSLYLLLGSYGFLKAASNSYIDNSFLHFRYNYKLDKVVRLEAFTQLQQNVITKINSRFLLGAGPRFKIIGSKKVHLYLGALAMYEVERETGNPQQISDCRSSNYLSFTYLPNGQTEFTTTTYYQPVYFNGKDYRLLNQSIFKIKTGKAISVNLNWTYQFDASPPVGIIKDTYNFSTGIELDL